MTATLLRMFLACSFALCASISFVHAAPVAGEHWEDDLCRYHDQHMQPITDGAAPIFAAMVNRRFSESGRMTFCWLASDELAATVSRIGVDAKGRGVFVIWINETLRAVTDANLAEFVLRRESIRHNVILPICELDQMDEYLPCELELDRLVAEKMGIGRSLQVLLSMRGALARTNSFHITLLQMEYRIARLGEALGQPKRSEE